MKNELVPDWSEEDIHTLPISWWNSLREKKVATYEDYKITIQHDEEEDNVKTWIEIEYIPDGSTYQPPNDTYAKCDIDVIPWIWYHKMYGAWFQDDIDVNQRDPNVHKLMYHMIRHSFFPVWELTK